MGNKEIGLFESDVIPDSGKTFKNASMLAAKFESDVIPDSGKTHSLVVQTLSMFESDVIPDSGKTILFRCSNVVGV